MIFLLNTETLAKQTKAEVGEEGKEQNMCKGLEVGNKLGATEELKKWYRWGSREQQGKVPEEAGNVGSSAR